MTMPKQTAWTWRQAILQSSLPPTTRHILLTISCFMNDMGGGCYPTTKHLARASGLSERAVCHHIAVAAGAGWLSVSKHGLAGQRWKNNQYEAQWPDVEGTDAGSVPNAEGTDAGSAPFEPKALTVVPKGTDRRSKKALTDGQSNSPDKHSNKPRESAREDFEKAYRRWPSSSTDSRGDALAAWEALSDVERLDAVFDADRCVAAFKAIGRKHLCSFATYLRERRWLGLPPRPVPVERAAPRDDGPRRPTRFEQRLASGAVDQDEVERLKAEVLARTRGPDLGEGARR